MTAGKGWHDASYSAEQRAYADGEYDGYWRNPQRVGTWANTEWTAYLRGWLSGVTERLLEPSDEEIDAWLRNITAMENGGER